MASISQWLQTVGGEYRFEAELLLAQHLKVDRTHILTCPERQLEPDQLITLNTQVARLKDDEPFAYLVGEREFWGLSMQVSPAVLVPRPETELLVEWVCKQTHQGARVHDLGTGSGAIAVAIAHERRDLIVSASDVSGAALTIAADNASRHEVNVALTQSDWFSDLAGSYDVIVSNPPYIAPYDPHLPALRHEPTIALVAADEGLADIGHIIGRAPTFLVANGWLILEHGYDQGPKVQAMLQTAGYENIEAHDDLGQHHRATSAVCP